MGKYATGTTMKEVIQSEVQGVTAILARSGLPKEDQKAVTDALKEMAYQWCSSNAMACAMENAAKQRMSEDEYAELCKAAIHSGIQEQKMKDTYPY